MTKHPMTRSASTRSVVWPPGLALSTLALYDRIVRRIGDEDPVEWLTAQIAARRPIGTLTPMRAAVRAMLIAQGEDAAGVDRRLPAVRGLPPRERTALDSDALRAYFEATAEASPAVRAILWLLPLTGLRISEACSLPRDSLPAGFPEKQPKRLSLRVLGKGGKERTVPLDASAVRVLADYLNEVNGGSPPDDSVPRSEWLFPGRTGHVQPDTVRCALRVLRQQLAENPAFAGNPTFSMVTPHVLRHTFATDAMRAGVSLRVLQALLGHATIATTAKYLHPSGDDLADAVQEMRRRRRADIAEHR